MHEFRPVFMSSVHVQCSCPRKFRVPVVERIFLIDQRCSRSMILKTTERNLLQSRVRSRLPSVIIINYCN